MECRAGTSIFGRYAGVGGGTVRVFCLLGSVLACVCLRLNRWGVAGQYDFSSFPGFVLAGTVRLKWWGAVFSLLISFSFVTSLGG